MFFKSYNIISIISCIGLVLILLLPQAVGYRPYHNALSIDGPRVVILLIILLASILFIKNAALKNITDLNISYFILFAFAILMILSSLFSENIYTSLFLSIKLITIWVIFSCAFDYLNNDISYNKYFLNALFFILIGLLAYSFLEFLLQTYVIPNWLRTSFYNFDEYAFINNRISFRNNLILSQGPFTWNHGFGGVLCSLIGIMLFKFEKYKFFGCLLAILFFLSILTTGMRAVYIATLFGLIIWMVYRFNFKNILKLIVCFFLACFIYSFKSDPMNILFFNDDMKININEYVGVFINEKYRLSTLKTSNFITLFLPFTSLEIQSFLENSGTLGVRIIGFIENLLNYENWWLTGYGVGAFQKPGSVPSEAIQYNDPGLFMLILFEFGIFPFLIFIFLIVFSFFKSIKNDNWMLSIGIVTWFIFSLSSWAIWPMLLITVFINKIFRS